MPGLDFNGTGLNTSKIQATSQPGLAAAQFTILACILPDSAGQSSVGTIFQTAAGTTSRVWFRIILVGSDLCLGLTVARATTNTNFGSNNRKVFPSTSTSVPAVVGAYFDDTSSPKITFLSTGNGVINDDDLNGTTNGTASAGLGTISGSDTTYTIGNIAAGGGTFDGVILWVAVWPFIANFSDLRNVAAGGMHPSMVADVRNVNTRLAFLDDPSGAFSDHAEPGTLWTPTAVSNRDFALPAGGEYFSPSGAQIMHYGYPQGVVPAAAAGDELHGAVVLSPQPVAVAPTAAATDEKDGAPALGLNVAPARAAGDELDGAVVVAPGAATVAPDRVASDEADPAPTLAPGAVPVAPARASSDEAEGAVTVAAGAVTVTPARAASDEFDGAVIVSAGAVPVTPDSVVGDETEGVPDVATTASVVTPDPAASDEADGAVAVAAGAVAVVPDAVGTEEFDGAPTVTPGAVPVSPGAVPGEEAVGFPDIAAGAVAVLPAAAASDERVGDPTLLVGASVLLPASAASDEAEGHPTVTPGAVQVTVVGVDTDEVTGDLVVKVNLDVAPGPVAGDELVGDPMLTAGAVTVAPSPALSDEQVGQLIRIINRLLGVEVGARASTRVEVGGRAVTGSIEIS